MARSSEEKCAPRKLAAKLLSIIHRTADCQLSRHDWRPAEAISQERTTPIGPLPNFPWDWITDGVWANDLIGIQNRAVEALGYAGAFVEKVFCTALHRPEGVVNRFAAGRGKYCRTLWSVQVAIDYRVSHKSR